MIFGSAESEHPTLTNGEIISDVFQPTVITIHQRQRQTDRQTTCDRNTALCTKVHRAVKTFGKCSCEQTHPQLRINLMLQQTTKLRATASQNQLSHLKRN